MSSSMSFVDVLVATLRSFGVIFTLAASGVYGERKEILTPSVTKGLGEISMNLTVPALLFSTLLGCKQDHSRHSCDSLSTIIGNSWPFLFLPFVYVGFGTAIGTGIAKFCRTESRMIPLFQASVAFGNSTGLPIVLLSVIHSQFRQDSDLGTTDPLPMLSVYLIFYPVLQWSVGSWLFRQTNLPYLPANSSQSGSGNSFAPLLENDTLDNETTANDAVVQAPPVSIQSPPPPPPELAWREIAGRSLQPPVIAVLLALFIGLVPRLREVLVDTANRNDDAPLQVVFDGIERLGQAAVPVNMLILGASLSRGLRSLDRDRLGTLFTTLCGIVATKMVLMPLFSVALVFLLSFSSFDHGTTHQTFFLVMMVVAAMPTANNMTVIAELNCDKDTVSLLSMAVLVQYVIGIILLPSVVCAVVLVAQSL